MDIESSKAAKADIEKWLTNIDESVRTKTSMHVIALFEECGKDTIFGRSIVEKITDTKLEERKKTDTFIIE